MKKINKYILGICLLVCFSLVSCNNGQISESSQTYLNAVDEMKSLFENTTNPFLFKDCSEDQWNLAIDKLKADIKKNKMSDDDVYYRMQEICAMLKNGHSSLKKLNNDNENYFPIAGQYIGDDFYIATADSKYNDILGAQIISINGISFADIEKKYSKIVSAENTQWLRATIAQSGFKESAFRYLGIWKNTNKFKVKKLDGSVETVNIDVVPADDYSSIMSDTNNYFAFDKISNSIRNKKSDNAYPQYWYTLDSENRILYFQYNTCLDKYDTDLNIPLIDLSKYPDFTEFSKSLIDFINKNNSKFDKIVVDISNNTGGNPKHLDTLINENLALFKSKRVYAIMTKNTFSAGTVAVNTLVEKCNATMIGEETGGALQLDSGNFFQLSSLPIGVEKANYDEKILNYAGKNSDDNMDGAIPDIKVDMNIQDVLNGVDPYYQAVIDN